MKYAHIVQTTGKVLGWYDDSIHTTIPIPNEEATDQEWRDALEVNANIFENG